MKTASQTITETQINGHAVKLARFRTDTAGNSAYYWTLDGDPNTESKYDGFGGLCPKADYWHYGARSKPMALREAELTLTGWAS